MSAAQTGWRNVTVDSCRTIHCMPINDLREHTATPECWCRPFQVPDEPRAWAHNSADRREEYEQGRKPS